MQIIPMTIEDYDAVYDLWLHTPGMGLNTADDSREGIAAYLRRNPTTCFTAKEGDRLLGAILAGHDGRRGYISHTAVREDAQRQGVGTALVEAVLEALQAEGIRKVALVVFARNEKGNAFWEKLGFTGRDDLVYRNKALAELVRIDT
ncbi:GNAT family N-acetyltransferase [Anaeromassilibacillus senegalensis]|uniref:GNAT family N-acetyltransferase n=1 Tax=Anaeromassilibacillus senegalensis TaxID=1673717 RepID=A0ABS9CMY0_9FIRM|nr:GNAT family N-acetyltransferase [Anaeromassilibacillus senegalensis]MCF2651527.1 GNAT family N-acetyltransferase [Anaeromassilibacillus senegalensis]